MRRILFLCIVVIIFVSAVANAEISEGKDSFTGEKYISSHVDMDRYFNTIHFIKRINENKSSYLLTLTLNQTKDEVISDIPIEIKIDNFSVYKMDDYRYKLNGPDSYGIEYTSYMDIRIPIDIASKLKDSEKVLIRYEVNRGLKYLFLVPENVLSEWKKVITTDQ